MIRVVYRFNTSRTTSQLCDSSISWKTEKHCDEQVKQGFFLILEWEHTSHVTELTLFCTQQVIAAQKERR